MRVLLALLFCAAHGQAAINATTQWYIRNGGAATGGGGFDATLGGKNYANQDACQVTIDNAAITATIDGSTITFTGATYTPTIADRGNIVNVITTTGGTPPTLTRYSITSHTATTWTIDIASGAVAATITSACMGGAFAKLSQWVLPNGRANGVSSTGTWIVWVKGGTTYTATSSNDWKMDAPVTGTPQITIKGYTTTPGDDGRFTLTSSTNSVDLISDLTGSTTWAVVNANLTHTAATRGICMVVLDSNDVMTIRNVTMDGCLNGINADNAGAHYPALGVHIIDSEIKNCTSDCVKVYSATTGIYPVTLRNSWIRGATGVGLIFATNLPNFQCYRSVISGNSSHGVSWNVAVASSTISVVDIEGCNFRSNGGDGFRAGVGNVGATGPLAYYIRNSISYGNGGFGFNLTAGTLLSSTFAQFDHNGYGDNISGNLNNLTAGTGDQTLTVDPFMSATDFALNNTAGGGAALRRAGAASSILSSTSGRDIGAVQTSGAVLGTPVSSSIQ
jgi:hypothetical protein